MLEFSYKHSVLSMYSAGKYIKKTYVLSTTAGHDVLRIR